MPPVLLQRGVLNPDNRYIILPIAKAQVEQKFDFSAKLLVSLYLIEQKDSAKLNLWEWEMANDQSLSLVLTPIAVKNSTTFSRQVCHVVKSFITSVQQKCC